MQNSACVGVHLPLDLFQFTNFLCHLKNNSGASTYECPDLRPFRVATSSGCKILLRLVARKRQGEKVGNSNLLTVGGKEAASCSSFAPTVRVSAWEEALDCLELLSAPE